jgi:hypothetical protein
VHIKAHATNSFSTVVCLLADGSVSGWYSEHFKTWRTQMKLKFACGLTAVAALILVLTLGSLAQNKGDSDADEGTKQTVEGLVRDIACPIQNHKSTSQDFNLQCALDCAKQGSPLIILTDDGTIYIPTSQQMPDKSVRAKLLPLVGKRVKATGLVYERNGTHSISIVDMVVVDKK